MFSQIYILLLLFVTTKTLSQQCLTTGGCTNFVLPYPTSSAPYSPPTSWQVLKNPATGNDALFNAGNYTKFTVISGNTYEWTYCEDYGGLSTSWDAQLTLFNEANLSSPLCFSTDVCGTNSNNAPYIRWTANFDGTVRLLTTAYSGTGCLSNSGSPYNKLAYKQTPGSGCTTPGTPSNAIGVATGQTTASLSWSSGNPTGSPTVTYYWTVSTSSNGSGVFAQGSTTNTSASASGLSCNTAYYLRVYASTSCNNSTSSYFTSTAFTTASCNSSNLLQGIDVSHWQGTINWTTVANTNVKFAYIKATEGFTGVDSKFNFNITNAVNTTIKVGAYHLARPENNSASNEVDNFLNIAENYTGIGYLPPLLDLEQAYAQAYIDQGNTWSQLAQWLNDWCTQVYSIKNRWPVLYADRCRAASLYSSYQNGTINSNVKLMIADYSNNAGSPYNYPGCNWVGWPWLFHQYSETGTVSGINGNVDLDVFDGDMTALNNLINGGSTPTATINSFTISPTTVCPGNSFSISNSITASAAISNVILGASIRLSGTSTIIDNTANDITTAVTSGSNTKQRNFTVPLGTANGTYDVISAVWKDVNGNGVIDAGDVQLSSKTNLNYLTVSSSSCCADTYESNNTYTTATNPFPTLFITVVNQSINSYIFSSSDVDWYRVGMDGPGTLTINLTSLPADYDIYLFDSDGTTELGTGTVGGTTNEQIIYNYNLSASTLKYIKVIGYSGNFNQCDDYVLGISWSPSATCSAPSAPSFCTNSIGSPANGLQHHINQTWSTVAGIVGYEYQYSWDGSNYQNGSQYQTVSTNIDWNIGDYPNQLFYTRVRAYKCSNPVQYSNWTYSSPNPIYTACDEPAIPSVNNSTASSMNVTLNSETPVANPSYTTYAIYCTTTNRYVQSNGTLGTSPYYQTKAIWGSKTVIGLSANTTYCFYASAKNMNGDIRDNLSNIACATTLNVTSIINSITDDNFKIYPNPNSGEFILEMDLNKSGNCQIVITNILGQKVYEETRFVSKEKNKIPIFYNS
jgi:GH25 family lysozyme M1 (1,4-beta-N-acetylmuramidase)